MIDTTFQDKLMSALKDAVGSYNEGVNPTEAVIKSAQQHSFNMDQTQRLVETFNTARTIHHFRKNAQSDSKAKDFELADGEKVVLALFDKQEVKEAYTLKDNYFKAPKNYNNPDFELPPIKTADFVDTDLNTQIIRAQKYIRSTEQLMKEASDQASTAVNQADLILDSVVTLLKKGTVDICKDRANRLCWSLVGNNNISPHILGELNSKLPAYMIATYDELAKFGAVIDDRDLNSYKVSIKEANDLYKTAMDLMVQHYNLNLDLNKFKDEFNKMAGEGKGSCLENFFLKRSAQPVDLSGINNPDEPVQQPEQTSQVSQPVDNKQGPYNKRKNEDKSQQKVIASNKGLMGELGSGMLSGALNISGKKMEGVISDLFSSQTLEDNKRISGRLNNLQRTTILQDLIINDPVISEVDPKVTAQAYNTIMELAPEVSLSKEVVRAILRQSVHALATSPFDATQWVELEKKIKEVKGTLPQKKFDGGQK